MKPQLPSSPAFWILSSGYRDAGDASLSLIHKDEYTGFVQLPCVFSYFRCIELALKAVLVEHSVSEKEITRDLGHRISKLILRAEGFVHLSKIGIEAEDRKLLDRYSDDYSDKWFEYPEQFWKERPRLEDLQTLAHRICEAVRVYKA